MNNWGLTIAQESILKNIFKDYLPKGKVIIYGSRAKGSFHAKSDIDLAISGHVNDDRHLIAKIKEAIDESDIPYLCDIQYLEQIKNPHLKDHIQRRGQILYQGKDI